MSSATHVWVVERVGSIDPLYVFAERGDADAFELACDGETTISEEPVIDHAGAAALIAAATAERDEEGST